MARSKRLASAVAKPSSPQAPPSSSSSSSPPSTLLALALASIPEWSLVLSLIFVGCCSNAYFLELATRTQPDCGTLLTLANFAATALVNLPAQLEWRRLAGVAAEASSSTPPTSPPPPLPDALDDGKHRYKGASAAKRGAATTTGAKPPPASSSSSSWSSHHHLLLRHIRYPTLRPLRVPLQRWTVQVALYFGVSLLNNTAFGYRVPMATHIVFRSGGLVVSMLVGWLVKGKRYSASQVASVVVVTVGILLATLATTPPSPPAAGASPGSGTTASAATSSLEFDDDGESARRRQYALGILSLLAALVLSALMGLYQESTFAAYGASSWREALFYSHALALPLFLARSSALASEWRSATRVGPPVLWVGWGEPELSRAFEPPLRGGDGDGGSGSLGAGAAALWTSRIDETLRLTRAQLDCLAPALAGAGAAAAAACDSDEVARARASARRYFAGGVWDLSRAAAALAPPPLASRLLAPLVAGQTPSRAPSSSSSSSWGMELPPLLPPLALNVATQLLCINGVHRLTSRVSSLSVTLVLSVRKAVSLAVSVLVVQRHYRGGRQRRRRRQEGAAWCAAGGGGAGGVRCGAERVGAGTGAGAAPSPSPPPLGEGALWQLGVGAALVLGGTLLYAWASSRRGGGGGGGGGDAEKRREGEGDGRGDERGEEEGKREAHADVAASASAVASRGAGARRRAGADERGGISVVKEEEGGGS